MLALGTVQFGLPYGVANISGQVSSKEIQLILATAKESGIDTIDTAIAYGDSEKSLGEVGVDGWNIVTKIPEIPLLDSNLDIRKWLRHNIKESLGRLNVTSIYGVLLHRPDQLNDFKYACVWDELQQLKDSGLIKNIGYSIYNYRELEELFPKFKPTLVQAPYNIFDRGLESSGWLENLYSNGVEVHTRSCFLQGLLLMEPTLRPQKFGKWNEIWYQYDEWVKSNNITPLEACLRFVLSDERISKIVVGVDNLKQLQEIISIINKKNKLRFINFDITDEELINPALWGNL